MIELDEAKFEVLKEHYHFAKEIKDLFRSKVRVAPSINFESAEYIAKIQMPPMSRKIVKFIDLR